MTAKKQARNDSKKNKPGMTKGNRGNAVPVQVILGLSLKGEE